MNRSMLRCPTRSLMLAMLAMTSGCYTTIDVEPATAREFLARSSFRPGLAFDFHAMQTPAAGSPFLSRNGSDLDGEDLAEATAAFAEVLVATEAFASVQRAKPGPGLHCEFQLRRETMMTGAGVLLGLSLGLIPDHFRGDFELVARASAPGRPPRDYRASSHESTWLWLPLLPVALIQIGKRSAIQQAVDAVVAQMAADGWLDRK